MNDVAGLTRTLKSVEQQDFSSYEYLVVDGASTDGSVELLKNNKLITSYISEKDVGVYHAMNKAIERAQGEWLVFMNAGDMFFAPNTLSQSLSLIKPDIDVIYSDWVYYETGYRVMADLAKLNVRHQSLIYRKSLHTIYGNYVVGQKVSISDYIFFLSISRKNWRYCDIPISICNQQGISANPSHFYQRLAAEIIFGKRSRVKGALIILIYPIYRFIKRDILRIRN